ncbi:GntR family transcriptional regulator [Sphingomonas cannabina]|uniref:GntR family transcriptional regulator n=1 Tax=Sphingomonas cannabina TaxID=2899123 RepID=UPI001F2E80D6|nr:GntR family transcriptional regulator [Sphingomonas cannabina]UIJ44792.1 GntR family transcriptional regulator [Sphingomonas cannabina]
MNSGQTSGRVYEALRLRLTGRGLRPGARLDPNLLAEEFGSSVTPVRDALHILVGEGLVETGQGEGFRLPHLDEPGLKDLYDWNGDLLLAALRRRAPVPGELSPQDIGDTAALTASVFFAIAHRSRNQLHRLAMRWANAKLHPTRLVETDILPAIAEEVSAIADAFEAHETAAVRRMIGAYHGRRQRVAAEIVRGLYRASDDVAIL